MSKVGSDTLMFVIGCLSLVAIVGIFWTGIAVVNKNADEHREKVDERKQQTFETCAKSGGIPIENGTMCVWGGQK